MQNMRVQSLQQGRYQMKLIADSTNNWRVWRVDNNLLAAVDRSGIS